MNTIDGFCEKRGFLFHSHGHGKWGAFPWWTFYKVENNDETIYSIEYTPISNTIKISSACGDFSGSLDSEEHLLEMLKVLRIDVDTIWNETKIKENESLYQKCREDLIGKGKDVPDDMTLTELHMMQ